MTRVTRHPKAEIAPAIDLRRFCCNQLHTSQLLFNFLMKDARWADVAANSQSGCVVTRVMASRKKCDNVIPLEIYTVNYRLLTSIY